VWSEQRDSLVPYRELPLLSATPQRQAAPKARPGLLEVMGGQCREAHDARKRAE
jgi:hypothetical protein